MSDETTRRVPLGPCDCPEQPHAEGDVAVLKKGSALVYGDTRRVGAAMASEGGDPLEGGIAMAVLMLRTILSWNKVRRDPRGRAGLIALPIGLDAIDNLSPTQSRALITVLNERSYMHHFITGVEEEEPEPAEGDADATVSSVQTPGDAPGPFALSEAMNGAGGPLLAAPPPPNPSSGPSVDGSAASTPSTTSSASPAPI